MPDKRENIMVALLGCLTAVNEDGGTEMAVIDRNGAEPIESGVRPALRMWDGDEVSDNAGARPATRNGPIRVVAQPCIALYVEGVGAAAGTAANALLARVRKQVWTNEALRTAIGSDPVISQDSLTQDLATGSKTEGAYLIHLSIPYQFNPANP